MKDYRYSGHTVTRFTVHIVWITKYRYKVLQGEVKERCRELLIQICDAEDVRILGGVVSADHVHMHLEYPATVSISKLLKLLKGRSSRLLQKEYSELKRRYWGKHLWAIGYGAWSTGNITDKIVEEYLKHHETKANEHSSLKLE